MIQLEVPGAENKDIVIDGRNPPQL